PTGAVTQYTYEKAVANLGNRGSMEYYRVKTREDLAGSVSNNKLTYAYTNNFSGYPAHNNPDALAANYKYSMSMTDANNLTTNYIFNNIHLNEKTELKQANNMISEISYAYNPHKLPTSIVTTQYNIGTTEKASKSETYTYDDWGN